MSDQSAKQQIVDKLKDVDTILVTVNSNPTVDELSAALGFTMLVNKLSKHATAVFSGEIPAAINFLNPEKTFENTVDSLRDFIIALDKEKADHLRYKVEGEMVKVFITPYRTTIDDRDLEFSQGDYNVEMVIALGVRNNDDLDRALADHGRIMHDATVASVSVGKDSSQLGSIHWHENDASSYSELLVSLSESLRNDKNLIDERIATAFLTGIVAATERFSNELTTSKSMTIAAQLMAAGANQQLIANKLEEAEEIEAEPTEDAQKTDERNDGTKDLTDTPSAKIEKSSPEKQSKKQKPSEKKKQPEPEPVKDKPAADGSMKISHEKQGDLDEVTAQVEKENQAKATVEAEEMLASSLAESNIPAASSELPSVADLQNDLKKAAEEVNQDAAKPAQSSEMTLPPPANTPPPAPAPSPSIDTMQYEPILGGTLNATSDQAASDKRREQENARNKQILTHGGGSYAAAPESGQPAVNSFNAPSEAGPETVNPLEDMSVTSRGHDLQPVTPDVQPQPQAASPPEFPTLADLDRDNRAPQQPIDASEAMEQALQSAPSASQQQQHIPSMPSTPQLDQNQMPPLPPMPPLPGTPMQSDGMPPALPDFSALPPLPSTATPFEMPPAEASQQPPAAQPQPSPQNLDPSQFQIPSQ